MPDTTPPPPGADEQWEQLLHQWRGQCAAAQPQPHFYGRVRARLPRATTPPRPLLPQWLRWPAYAALLATLVLVLSGDSAALGSGPYDARPAASPGR
ncbi:hypothetical protein EJV47_08525 [Hymenobacter gummosus]|uniref:Uncharacterized protein n=1 Tax=Hymenobacter gummosus TaxID=1776032 RepID=A0A3S0K6B4_9BACT|nr:hypothetical protein [Hymenobacter gummosus]RTQ50667.1 hypothetical protein EJV47_08525 [Hymenobacter gummosus]